MNEIEIYATLREVLKPLLVNDFPSATLIRSYQGTIQGTPSTPVVFMTTTIDNEYGFPRTDYARDPGFGTDSRIIETKTVQVIETRVQFMAIAPDDPENENLPTSGDVLRRFAMYLRTDAIIAQLRDRGLNVLPFDKLNIPRITSDSDAFQAFPSFDCVMQHEDVLTIQSPAFDRMETGIHSV